MELALNRRSADGSCDERRSVVRTAIAIGVAGALGTLARYGVDGAVARKATAFPWGTFTVNVSGSFLLGLVFTLLGERFAVAPWVRGAIAIGFLGAYTTFSTLSLETYRLLEARSLALGAANVVGSAAAGLLALYGGVVLGRAL
jgi:fluoride exporter